MGYTHAFSILHLAALALGQVGASVEQVSYPVFADYTGQEPFWTAERERRFYADARNVFAQTGLTAKRPCR